MSGIGVILSGGLSLLFFDSSGWQAFSCCVPQEWKYYDGSRTEARESLLSSWISSLGMLPPLRNAAVEAVWKGQGSRGKCGRMEESREKETCSRERC